MSDQPRGRKRIAGRRPARPAGTPPTDAGTPQDDARTPQAEDLATVSGTTPDAPAVEDEQATPEGDATTDEAADDTADEAATPDEEKADTAGLSGVELSPAGAGGRSGRVLVGVLAALLVVTLGVGGVLGVQAWNGHQKEARRDAAAGAAAKAAALVLSYDYRKLPQDFGAARQTLTPEFAQKFDQTTKLVGEQATKTKATVKAEVREVSVSNSSADVVNVLLFVNQTTSSTVTQGKPRVDLNRARFTMVRSDGRWLVQEVAGL